MSSSIGEESRYSCKRTASQTELAWHLKLFSMTSYHCIQHARIDLYCLLKNMFTLNITALWHLTGSCVCWTTPFIKYNLTFWKLVHSTFYVLTFSPKTHNSWKSLLQLELWDHWVSLVSSWFAACLKYGCWRASAAEIRFAGSKHNMRASKSAAAGVMQGAQSSGSIQGLKVSTGSPSKFFRRSRKYS